MSLAEEVQYDRAMNLSDAITEQFLFEQFPQLAGPVPVDAPSWEAHRQQLGDLLRAFGWAIKPTDDNKPEPNILDQVPMGLILHFRSYYDEKSRTVLLTQINNAADMLEEDYTFGQHRALMTHIEMLARQEAINAHTSPR